MHPDPRKFIEYEKKGKEIRGAVLDMATFVEMAISNFITSFFASEELKDFFNRHFMYDTMTYENKKLIIQGLNKNGYLKELNPYKQLNDDIGYIQILRNQMAHSNLWNDVEVVNNYTGESIMFVSFLKRKEKEVIIYLNPDDTRDNKDQLIFSFSIFTERADRLANWLHSAGGSGYD